MTFLYVGNACGIDAINEPAVVPVTVDGKEAPLISALAYKVFKLVSVNKCTESVLIWVANTYEPIVSTPLLLIPYIDNVDIAPFGVLEGAFIRYE